jgi:hypothetical protein
MPKLCDINLYAIGNTIQLAGAIYSGDGKAYLCFLPDEQTDLPMEPLEMDSEDWKVFLRQTDLMELEILAQAKDGSLAKAIIRKSQRAVDPIINWNCFRRDNYSCRYCGTNKAPLTVDHLVRWEEGGPSIEANMLSSCRKCNKVRGDKLYGDWLLDPYYIRVSKGLSEEVQAANKVILSTLDAIPRKMHIASR